LEVYEEPYVLVDMAGVKKPRNYSKGEL